MSAIHYTKRGSEAPASMPQHYDTHEAWKSKGVGYRAKQVFKDVTTSASYEDSLVFDARLLKTVGFQIANKHASNTVYWKILGCFDPKYWEEVLAETLVPANTSPPMEWTQKPFLWFKIQVKNGSGAGLVDAFIGGKIP